MHTQSVRLTLASVRRQLRALRIQCSADTNSGDYVVNFVGGKDATSYHTNDLHDALDTGIAMATKRDADAAQILQDVDADLATRAATRTTMSRTTQITSTMTKPQRRAAARQSLALAGDRIAEAATLLGFTGDAINVPDTRRALRVAIAELVRVEKSIARGVLR